MESSSKPIVCGWTRTAYHCNFFWTVPWFQYWFQNYAFFCYKMCSRHPTLFTIRVALFCSMTNDFILFFVSIAPYFYTVIQIQQNKWTIQYVLFHFTGDTNLIFFFSPNLVCCIPVLCLDFLATYAAFCLTLLHLHKVEPPWDFFGMTLIFILYVFSSQLYHVRANR